MIPLQLTGTRLEMARKELAQLLRVMDDQYRFTDELARLSGLSQAKVQQAIRRNENQFEWIMVKKPPRSHEIMKWRRKRCRAESR